MANIIYGFNVQINLKNYGIFKNSIYDSFILKYDTKEKVKKEKKSE